jgi:dihydrofolate reductase
MRKLGAFIQTTLDGYFAGPAGDISWAHAGSQDAEFQAFVAENAKGGGQLLFGRVTYEMMASYWPTSLAAQNDPIVAERMNKMPKVVFSRTLDKAAWSGTQLLKGDLATEVRKLKQEPGPHLAILGSGSIISQLAEAGLIDEYQFVVNPVILGQGRTPLAGIKRNLALKLTRWRTFGNGKVFLCYEPAT